MIFGALLAGGVGSRMNIENMPKQFLPLNDKPIFVHTLQKFLMCSQFDAIYLGVHKDWLGFVEDTIKEYGLDTLGAPIHVTCGGGERNDTIMNIIDSIEQAYGVSDEHIIVTHDSVRPFVKISTIEANIKAMETCDACDTVCPATDTIVTSEGGEYIDSIPVRSTMYQGQTPQTFRMSALKNLYSQMTAEQKRALTDACKIFVEFGKPVALVESDATNIKLTTIADYKIAQAMISCGIE